MKKQEIFLFITCVKELANGGMSESGRVVFLGKLISKKISYFIIIKMKEIKNIVIIKIVIK